MPANTIVHRVFDFIRKNPPFSLVDDGRLLEIAALIKIKYVEPDQLIFNERDPPGEFIYLVREGSVKLSHNGDMVDICDEGDLFGVRSMLSRKPYVLTAITMAETLLYLIPVDAFRPVFENNPEVALYFAAGLAGGQAVLRDEEQLLNIREKYQWKSGPEMLGAIPATTPLIACQKTDAVKTVAQLMSRHDIGSMVITNDSGYPVGIITDTDLRKKIATGAFDVNIPVESIMNHPVVTVRKGASFIEMMITMMTQNIHHLCVTEDGSAESKAIGIFSGKDMLLEQGNHPAIIVKKIAKTHDIAQLSYLRDKAEKLLEAYLDQGAGITFIARVLTIVNDALIKKAITLALRTAGQQFEDPKLGFCWLSLGSEGREEQLLRTDIDNAILYEDPPDEQQAIAKAKTYFLHIGRCANDILMQCGFEKCPADIMASNPDYCLSLSEWKKKFGHWIKVPEPQALMNSTIFFDFRAVYGDMALEAALRDFLIEAIGQGGTFINHLAKNALGNPPPLTFFKNFIVERGGEHKDEFDLKKRAMMPLADAARVLILSHRQLAVHHTAERFKKLMHLEPQKGKLFEEAGMAYEWLMGLRTRFGLMNNDSGRFLPIASLNKIEKQMLRNAFVPIKELQQLMEVRFQLDYFPS